MTRGLFIVIEGMDNAGKTTFVNAYVDKYPLTQRIKLPTPEIFSLMERCPKEQWHDIFHENIVSVMKTIIEYLNNGINVICDRYIYSHFVYEAMTSKETCVFKDCLNPDVIVYFKHSNTNKLPKKDFMERSVNVEQGQQLFDELFKKSSIPVVHVAALKTNSSQIAFTYLEELFGKRLYSP